MALLYSYALACALEQYSLTEALPAYVKARRNHVMIYQAMSWAFTPMYQSHSQVLPLLCDWILAPMSQASPIASMLTSLVKGSMIDACKGLSK
jgi:2-polyprenyl-6-methoxyphenol hydroxylase-like FAD-dependent oxidoreductase